MTSEPLRPARDYAKAALNALGYEQALMSQIDAMTDLIRARDAEVRADERAKVLAGFTEERRVVGPSRIGYDANGHGWAYPATHERRLVGPWEPTP